MDDATKDSIATIALELQPRIARMVRKAGITQLEPDDMVQTVVMKMLQSYRGKGHPKHIEACIMNATKWAITDAYRKVHRRSNTPMPRDKAVLYERVVTEDLTDKVALEGLLGLFKDRDRGMVVDFYLSGMSREALERKYKRGYRSLQRRVANLISQVRQDIPHVDA